MKLVDISRTQTRNIYKLETNSKIKNISDSYRETNDFKKGYQPRTNIVKD